MGLNGVYTDCRGWFGLVQDLIGQKLERYSHIWLACSFDGFAFKWLSMDRKSTLIPKLT